MRSRQILHAVIATIASSFGSSVQAEPGASSIYIHGGQAKDTLKEFSNKTGFQYFLSSPEILENVNTRSYSGQPNPRRAIEEMLHDTQLTFAFFDTHTIEIMRRKPAVKATRADAPEVLIQRKSASSDWSSMRGPHLLAIDLERAGVNTIGDFLRTLPWNPGGGGCYDDLIGSAREGRTNSTLACGANLHGLGAGATLILINGRPVAYGGTAALFADVSRIPVSAIEEIQVTNDGSYTVYAASAIAGVMNFILKPGFEGFESQASWAPSVGGRVGEGRLSQSMGTTWNGGSGSALIEYYHRDALFAEDRKAGTSNLTPWGGGNYGTLFGTPANVSVGPRIWGLNPFQTNVPTQADFIEGKPRVFDTRESTDLLPSMTRVGGLLSGSLDVNPRVQVRGTALITWRGVTDTSSAQGDVLTLNSHNPFYVSPTGGNEPLTVYYGFLHALGPTTLGNSVWNGDFDLSVSARLDSGWNIEDSFGYSFETQHEIVANLFNPYKLSTLVDTGLFNPFGRNSESILEKIRSQSEFKSTSGLGRERVIARGPLTLSLLGDIYVIAGLDYRFETFDSREVAGSYASAINGNGHRNAIAAFGQVCIPFGAVSDPVCDGEHKSPARRPQLTVGWRYESVQGFGGHPTPAVQLRWSPWDHLTFKGIWSLSAKTPGLADLMQTIDLGQLITLPNPSSTSPTSTALLLSGGNAGLDRETAETWTFGAILKSDIAGGLEASLQYYSLVDRNRIDQPEIGADVLTSPLTSFLVTHNPTPEQRRAACKLAGMSDSAGNCSIGPFSDIVDARLHNVTRLDTNGLDLDVKQTLDSRFITSLGLTSTYIFKYVSSGLSGPVNLVSSPGYPDQFRARGFAVLDRGSYEVAVIAQYANGYHDFVDKPNRDVGSFTTVDLHFKRRFGGGEGEQSCTSDVSVDVQNVFNRSPPFVNLPIGLGFDSTNAGVLGRVVKVGVKKCW